MDSVSRRRSTARYAPNRPRTSREWLDYYDRNAADEAVIPWDAGPETLPQELRRIASSLQAWQLGETSDGAHLLRAAKSYAEALGDPLFIAVVRLFIKEEQRHGETLGRYLDLSGAGRTARNWGDTLFRAVRYALPRMEAWVTPVIMVETMAMLYYRAVHDATRSRVLRAVCRRILRDEVSHLRFHQERLAILLRDRPALLRGVTMFVHRLLFGAICLAVWAGHHRALRAGGVNFARYWTTAWIRMGHNWSRMNPRRYDWSAFDEALVCEIDANAVSARLEVTQA